jgi:hypothetical protein
MKSSLKIFNFKEIQLDRDGNATFRPGLINVSYAHMPMLFANKLTLEQNGQKKIIKLPKESYHNEFEFTLRGTDTNLDYDIYMRKTSPKITGVVEKNDSITCQIQKTGTSWVTGNVVTKTYEGRQTVLTRVTSTVSTIKMSLIRDGRTEAEVSEVFTDTDTLTLAVVSGCME